MFCKCSLYEITSDNCTLAYKKMLTPIYYLSLLLLLSMLGQIAGFKPVLLEGSSAHTAAPGTPAHKVPKHK